MQKDYDKEIGFWIENLPYIWVNGKKNSNCKRFYLVDENYNVYDQEQNIIKISDNFSTDKLVCLLKIKTDNKCVIVRNSFLVWVFTPYSKIKSSDFNSNPWTTKLDIRIEGKTIYDTIFKPTYTNYNVGDIKIELLSPARYDVSASKKCVPLKLPIYTLQENITFLFNTISKHYGLPENAMEILKKIFKTKNSNTFSDLLSKSKKLPYVNRSETKVEEIIYSLPKDYLFENSVVVDFGAGDAEIVSSLAKKYNLKKECVFAIDLKPLKPSELYTSLKNTKNIPSDSVDLIILFEVLHHIPQKAHVEIIKELKRCLKSGGFIIVKEHDFIQDGDYELMMELFHLMWYNYKQETIDETYPIFNCLTYLEGLVDLECHKIETWEKSNYQRIFKTTFGGKTGININYTAPEFYDLDTAIKLIDTPFTTSIIKKAELCTKLSDIPHSIPYFITGKVPILTSHVGQIKLFLTELQFLTNALENFDDKAIVIYAGSAPSNKLSYLSNLFPNVKFVLVDPNEHYIKYGDKDQYNPEYANEILYFVSAPDSYNDAPGYKMRKTSKIPENQRSMFYYSQKAGILKKIRSKQKTGTIPDNISDIILKENRKYFIIEDFYTNDLSEKLKGLCTKSNVVFISDIRSKGEHEEYPSDLDILWNCAMMKQWLKILKPKLFMLKFRCPYEFTPESTYKLLKDYEKNMYTHEALESSDIPFIENFKKGIFEFIDGNISLQAFAAKRSTETRLIGKSLKIKKYNIDEYNNKLFYYNTLHRPYGWHNINKTCINEKHNIDHCGDCALMCHIFEEYKNKYTQNDVSIITLINDLFYMVKRSLKIKGSLHGNYYKKYKSVDELVKLQPIFIKKMEEMEKK